MDFKSQIKSTVTNGTAPFNIASTTLVTNLNADKIDGLDIPSITGNATKVLTVNSGATALEWTTITVGSMAAANVSLTDVGAYYTATNVEAAFQEIGPLVGQTIIAVDEVATGALPRDADTLGGVAAASYAKLSSPTFSGTPTAPTATTGTNTTQVATTAFVNAEIANDAVLKSVLTTTGDIIYASSASTPARLGIGTNGQYLKSDGTKPVWGTLTIPAGLTAGSASVGFVNYNGTTKAAGQWDGGTVNPTNTTRLNYDGYLYATKLYSNGVEVGAGGVIAVDELLGDPLLKDADTLQGHNAAYFATATDLNTKTNTGKAIAIAMVFGG